MNVTINGCTGHAYVTSGGIPIIEWYGVVYSWFGPYVAPDGSTIPGGWRSIGYVDAMHA